VSALTLTHRFDSPDGAFSRFRACKAPSWGDKAKPPVVATGRRLCCLMRNPRCPCIPDFFDTCSSRNAERIFSGAIGSIPKQVGELCHAEALVQTQASEQSLTRVRVCRRISLDGKRCLRLNQPGVGEYATTLTG
jgi:hypothetical protein